MAGLVNLKKAGEWGSYIHCRSDIGCRRGVETNDTQTDFNKSCPLNQKWLMQKNNNNVVCLLINKVIFVIVKYIVYIVYILYIC